MLHLPNIVPTMLPGLRMWQRDYGVDLALQTNFETDSLYLAWRNPETGVVCYETLATHSDIVEGRSVVSWLVHRARVIVAHSAPLICDFPLLDA